MEMKRVTLGFSILALSTVFVLGCKKTANVAPEPDTEVQSSVYATYANYVASDIDMICSFMGENLLLNHFYIAYPGSASGTSGTMTAIRDTNGTTTKRLIMSWNQTRCLDGRVRDGSIFMDYGLDSLYPNAKYTREFKFAGKITLANYKVDGWLIELYDPNAPVYLYNTLPTSSYSPSSTKLTWKFAGKLKFTHPTDPKKNMVWDGNLFKTLDNTSDIRVFAASKQAAINWSLAVVKYDGTVNGSGPQIDAAGNVTPNVSYAMTINNQTPLVRDFQCYPDKVSGVAFTATVGNLLVLTEEYHPFKMGVASFTVGSAYPRQIYYGNEGEPQLPLQCDNSGEVLIKGISYVIDFMQ
jgi:hypothetical protein